jgi:hypothetical protein
MVIGRGNVIMCCLVRAIDEYGAKWNGNWQGKFDNVPSGHGYR